VKRFKNIAKYLIFFTLGVFLFWWIYKDLKITELKSALEQVNYSWILLSIMLGMIAQLSRALRWRMLITPLGHYPRKVNLYLSVMVLYLVNLALPRAGEVARCTVVSKYENISVSKLVGTVIIERTADLVMLIIIAIVVFGMNVGLLKNFMNANPELHENAVRLLSLTNILLGFAILAVVVALFFIIRPKSGNKVLLKFLHIKDNFTAGMKTILQMEKKWLFLAHTVFIYLMWLLMLYVVFLAYPPTAHLTLGVGVFTFLMSGLAMIAPVQAGIGPWHFMVIESLFLFGIEKSDGKIFALLAHSSTNLIYLFTGLIALMLIPVVNRSYRPTSVK